MQNRVFFPQSALDQWIVDGAVDLQGGVLTLVGEGRTYDVAESVRVVREVSGAGDVAQLVGKVKPRAWLEQQGAEIVESSMLLGEAAYDVDPGWMGVPVGAFSDRAAESAAGGTKKGKGGKKATKHGPPKTDEELLARFLAKNL
ncbi:MAG TPA: hypothetical protein VF765_21490 [Polyangiaceae bacterium]